MIRQILPEDLSVMINTGESVYLLDVRHEWESQYCTLPESTLIPLPELPSRIEEVEPPDGALVVVYCHHGVRSLSGAAILQRAGIENVCSLSGGIDAWSLRIDPKVGRY